MTVVTRFAPSPTGFLHIGGARTALFNWLFARHHGGTYLLRIEDTDRERSTQEAIDAILDGLNWLGLDHDGEIVFQSRNAERHAEVARRLLEEGKAYHCYCSPEELEEMRAKARAEKRPMRYDGTWRDRDPSEAPAGVKPVVRIKMPQEGSTTINDAVQGEVTVSNDQLDDFILLRADGSPTYMLSVVVDDHDMGITHVIRGDDHLTNMFRQYQLYKACGWDVPTFGHIPLIHGPDGAKLSKRHGALGVDAYREMGFLPEAICNYLLRLGWGHGDEELIDRDRAISLFDLDGVGRSAARFDFAKLEATNHHYMKLADNGRLVDLLVPMMEADVDDAAKARLTAGMDGLKERARTLKQLAENALFYVVAPTFPLANEKAAKLLDTEAVARLRDLANRLDGHTDWNEPALEARLKEITEETGLGLGKFAQPLRAALTGSNSSPGIFEVMAVLGKDECLRRMRAVPA